MKEHPIIFNTEMVKAILDGRKTVTRRPVKSGFPIDEDGCLITNDITESMWRKVNKYLPMHFGVSYFCPFGQIGDRLYVRETWAFDHAPLEHDWLVYRADGHELETTKNWSPSIHMPKKYARIWLEITDIRVERVQEITFNELGKEGFKGELSQAMIDFESYFNNFSLNPWVWVIEFKRVGK